MERTYFTEYLGYLLMIIVIINTTILYVSNKIPFDIFSIFLVFSLGSMLWLALIAENSENKMKGTNIKENP